MPFQLSLSRSLLLSGMLSPIYLIILVFLLAPIFADSSSREHEAKIDAKLDKLEHQIKDLCDVNDKLESKVSGLQDELEEMKGVNDEMRREVANLNEINLKLGDRWQSLEDKIFELERFHDTGK